MFLHQYTFKMPPKWHFTTFLTIIPNTATKGAKPHENHQAMGKITFSHIYTVFMPFNDDFERFKLDFRIIKFLYGHAVIYR